MIFLEASAKTGESVEEAFLKCSKTILAKIETGELDPERIGSGKIDYPFQFRKYGYGKIKWIICCQTNIYFIYSYIQVYNMGSHLYEEINKPTQGKLQTVAICHASFSV